MAPIWYKSSVLSTARYTATALPTDNAALKWIKLVESSDQQSESLEQKQEANGERQEAYP